MNHLLSPLASRPSGLSPLALLLALLLSQPLAAQYARTVRSTGDGTILLQQADQEMSSSTGTTIRLDARTAYQTVDGFGYAMTYSSCYNLMHMSAADRHALLQRTFSQQWGYGCSYVRVSLGCSDFSSTEYTYCDQQGLEHFALHRDEMDYILPVLREVRRINPQLKILASPWTCPRWMKVNDLQRLGAHNSWTGGHLNPAHRTTYAQYFVRYLRAMQAEGLPVYAVTPQNEPLNAGNCASLLMPWDEEAAFVRELAKAFRQEGLETKIYLFDHNFNYDGQADQEDYPVRIYNAIDETWEGSELIVGSAWHDYGGSPSELDDINAKAPGREVIFTETSIGTWNDGRNFQKRFVADMQHLIFDMLTRQCRTVLVWNFMLDLQRGPNLDGGCTTCYGALDIDQSDYRTVTINSHYAVISHLSAVVRPGARRIRTVGTTPVQMLAFENPDGSYGVVMMNTGSQARTLRVGLTAVGYHTVEVPAGGVVSLLLSPTDPNAHEHDWHEGICRSCLEADPSYLPASPDGWHEVSTAAQLRWVAAMVESGQQPDISVRLTAPIDLTGEEQRPIGTASSPYSGRFDGQLFPLTGVSAMLFGSTDGASLSGIALESGSIERYTTADAAHNGTIVGEALPNRPTTLEGSYSLVPITSTNKGDVGGLAGKYYGEIRNCFYAAAIDGANTTGGLVGSSSSPSYPLQLTGSFSFCSSLGKAWYTDGLVGWLHKGSTIEQCYCINNVGSYGSHYEGTARSSARRTRTQFASGYVCYQLNSAAAGASGANDGSSSANGVAALVNDGLVGDGSASRAAAGDLWFQTLKEDPHPVLSPLHLRVAKEGSTYVNIEPLAGDNNNDGQLDHADLLRLLSHLLGLAPSSSFDPLRADLNSDGRLSIADLTLLIRLLSAGE